MRNVISGIALSLFFVSSGQAQGISAIRSIPNYVCMALAMTPEQLTDPRLGVPLRNEPRLSAPVASWAPSVVIVPAGDQLVQGFFAVLLPNGKSGWIQASAVRPWASPSAPRRRCIPSVMSNGLIGYDFK